MTLMHRLKGQIVRQAYGASRPFRPAPVCMLHCGRVGSTVLEDMLGQHPRVTSLGEIYNNQWERLLKTNGFESYERGPDPYRLMRREILRAGRTIALFELKFLETLHLQMVAPDLPTMLDDLRAQGVSRFIIVDRRNLLRRVASAQKLRESGVSHIRSDQPQQKRLVRLDLNSVPFGSINVPFTDYCDQVTKAYAELRRLTAGMDVIDLTYESDIMSDPKDAYLKCCDFMGLTPEEIAPRLRRTNPQPVSGILENYDEVAQALAGTPYAWMLSD